ncbi:glycosyltransferase family 9 protein [Streptomyces sp. NPDC006368]|uniref:glycosyltransferase family 9 protein n=1 Tax=Streptomyces sp. NPDC006368 TaxID=3156760 RepID=UPI0033AD5C6D
MRPRLLVLRALGLGDLLAGVPALRALRRAFPGYETVLAAPEQLAAPAAASGAVDTLLPASAPGRAVPARLDWAGPPPEVAVDLHGKGPSSHLLLHRMRPGRLLAFAHPGTPGIAGPEWTPDEHERVRWCRLLEWYGIPADPDDLLLPAPEAASPFPGAVLVHPGAESAARRWPAERYAEVVRELLRRGHRVALTGGPGEDALVRRIADAAAGTTGATGAPGPATALPAASGAPPAAGVPERVPSATRAATAPGGADTAATADATRTASDPQAAGSRTNDPSTAGTTAPGGAGTAATADEGPAGDGASVAVGSHLARVPGAPDAPGYCTARAAVTGEAGAPHARVPGAGGAASGAGASAGVGRRPTAVGDPGARLRVFAGGLPYERLAALVAGAAAVVSGDTGIAHLAVAYGTPSVTLFGPVPPRWWGPPRGARHVVLWHPGPPGDPHGREPDPLLLRIRPADVLTALSDHPEVPRP